MKMLQILCRMVNNICSQYEDSCLSASYSCEVEWIVDSGASFHVTLHRELFSSGDVGA